MTYILYNPYSGNGSGKEQAEICRLGIAEENTMTDMTAIESYAAFFSGLSAYDRIMICGGDGTLNRFINDTDGLKITNEIYYFPTGTGNDFAADIGKKDCGEPFLINDYLRDLPSVTVKGKTYKFLNGVGYGIDGYCCEVGDELRRQNKPANYTAIAIKGLLFHFKPVNATVTVDGKEYLYKKVWLAPTMYGRRYGGGMIPTPGQERGAEDKTLSVMLFHGSGRVHTLMIFPSIFQGKHVSHTKQVEVLTGKNITVKFDRPTPLQIDGETILGVEEYTASVASAKVENRQGTVVYQ